MRRLALLAVLALGVPAFVVSACEDDTFYKAGPSTFQNDVLDAGADAVVVVMDAGGGGDAAGTDAGP